MTVFVLFREVMGIFVISLPLCSRANGSKTGAQQLTDGDTVHFTSVWSSPCAFVNMVATDSPIVIDL